MFLALIFVLEFNGPPARQNKHEAVMPVPGHCVGLGARFGVGAADCNGGALLVGGNQEIAVGWMA
jgi:hypothetical protein